MNIKKILKKMEITNVQMLDFRAKEDLVKAISNKISARFTDSGIEYSTVFLKLINTDMYLADIGKETGKACYIYKNQSIYIDRSVNLQELTTDILDTTIRRLQEVRNKSGKIQKLGLCTLDKVKTQGYAINEAGIEYLLYKLENVKSEKAVAYGITLNSVSSKYPTLTNLIRQIELIVGEKPLVQSIMTGTNDCKKEFSKALSGSMYSKIVRIMELICTSKNTIIDLNNKILFNRKIKEIKKQDLRNRVERYSRQIQADYVYAQRELCISYFDKSIDRAKAVEELEILKGKMMEYKKIIGISENPADNFFDKYSLDTYYKIELKSEMIIKNSTALAVTKNGKLKTAVKTTKKLTQASIENTLDTVKKTNE